MMYKEWLTEWLKLSIPIILSAFSLFIFFEQVDVKRGKKIISVISGASFTVYLLHMQPVLEELYDTTFNLNVIAESNMYFPMVFVAIVAVFVLGVVFEILRSFAFNKLFALFKKKKQAEQ